MDQGIQGLWIRGSNYNGSEIPVNIDHRITIQGLWIRGTRDLCWRLTRIKEEEFNKVEWEKDLRQSKL